MRTLDQLIDGIKHDRRDLLGFREATEMDPISRERVAEAQMHLRLAWVHLRLLTRDFSGVIGDGESAEFATEIEAYRLRRTR